MGLGTNNRLFWPCQCVGFAALGSNTFTPVHGLQSFGIDTNFNLEQIFEISQIEVYESVEDIPEVQVTMEKVIDGYPLLYHLATPGAPGTSLVNRSAQRCSVALSLFSDLQDSASGTPNTQVTMSGLYFSALSYTLPVQGNCTESLTLVGSNKVWKSGTFTFSGALFNNEDVPMALSSGLGGVQRRENVMFDGNAGVITLLPAGRDGGIPGISTSGTNNRNSNGFFACSIQNITVSTDLGRDSILQLGSRTPFFRYANFPVDVNCEIEVHSIDGDLQDALDSTEANVTNKTIKIVLQDTTILDLGTKNRLNSVSQNGGNAGDGSNVVNTYSYTNSNRLTISHSLS